MHVVLYGDVLNAFILDFSVHLQVSPSIISLDILRVEQTHLHQLRIFS